MASLSDSYAQTLELAKGEKWDQATAVYRQQFVPTIKKLYSEAAQTYPVRFKKIDDWCAWTRNLYLLTRKAEAAFADKKPQEALPHLAELRRHIHNMHVATEVLKTNDHIYAFQMETSKDTPAAKALKEARGALDGAQLSAKAKKNLDAYKEAKATWVAAVDPLLADGEIQPGERDALRAATDTFYRAFGIQFE